ncbi:MAG: hypothetical protein D6736_09690 [Nitrospinota bacterium]|nr:MAG: hypothetical protein D6736_09690 [Nitrospinota bacterium]
MHHDESLPHEPVVGRVIPLVLELDPPYAGKIDAFEVRIGRSVAQTRLIARRFFDRDGQVDLGFLTGGHLRAIAQLWHALHRAHGAEIPVSFLRLDDEKKTYEPVMEGFITSADLEAVLQEVERKCNLGVRTRSLDPPIYLEAFWGPRRFGRLDAMIARLAHFNIVPDALLEKARRVDAPQNWAVVYPQGLPDRDQVLFALEPLIQHRGGRVFELSHGHDPAVIDRFLVELSRMPIEERPYYLLALGDFDVLSMEFQYFLQSFGATGRLAFSHPHAYREYAEKILRAEAGLDDSDPPGPTYIATDYDDVNARNYRELVQPLATVPDLPRPREVLARGRAYKERVLEVLRRVPPHSPLLIFAHGFEHLTTRGQPVEAVFEDMRQFQGALILDDFLGPRPLDSTTGLLCATDVADGPVSPGGIVILHACYSAGTIDRDTMPEWVHLQMPARLSPPTPFISRLAQALLANPQGPVAVYGHVNRSHQANYYNPDVENMAYPYLHYAEMLKALVQGLPIGWGRESCRRMTIHYMDQAMTLSYQIEWLLTGRSRGGTGVGWPRKGVGAYERSFLQYSFGTCNFRNYLILGDPMARIRKTRPEE